MLATIALCLVGHIDPTHFAGALNEDGEISSRPVTEMSREELTAEMSALDGYRTNFISPTVIAGVGAVLCLFGIVFVGAGIVYVLLPTGGAGLSGLVIAGYVLLGIGAAALIAGGILLAVGLVKLFPALAKRKVAMERREDLQKRLDETDPLAPPPPSAMPPPPPGALNDGPLPSILLATF